MANVTNLTAFLTDVATAIRQKTGITENIRAENFDTEILNISTANVQESKSILIDDNGTYVIAPDEGFDAMGKLTVKVDVASSSNQHMPFYLLESDDDGNLWCVNNYNTMEYSPYELDIDGNLIVNQDDEDTAIYWINENMELEVEVNG